MLGAVLFMLAQTTTTNCWADALGQVHCLSDTTPGANSTGPIDYSKQLERGRNLVPQYRAPDPAAREYAERKQRERRVAELIANGDCAGAKAYALKQGDLTLAQIAVNLCSKP